MTQSRARKRRPRHGGPLWRSAGLCGARGATAAGRGHRIGPTVIVFLKQPVAGRVKTRLARGIGAVAATWWFRHATARLLRRLADPRWRLVIAASPDAAVQWRGWPRGLAIMPQGRGDLGARMAQALRAAPGPAIVVGGDIPGLDRKVLRSALVALGQAEAVFGPARDGGYYLVGLRHPGRMPHGFLKGVRWSGPHALADSLATLGRWRVGVIETLDDVDTAADLLRLGRRPSRA